MCRHPGFLWRDAATKDRVLNAIKTTAEKLVDLLDYVEQVVRLDERVAFRLAGYRLPDGAARPFTVACETGRVGRRPLL